MLELEEGPQVFARKMPLSVQVIINYARRKGLFVRLPLQNFFFDGTGSNETIHKTSFLLTVAPNTGQSLLIRSRIPVGIKEHETICTNKIQTTPTSFRTQQKDKFRCCWVVESVDKFLALVNIHGAVKSEKAPATQTTQALK